MLVLDLLRRWRQARPRELGAGVEIDTTARFQFPDRIALGDHVYIGPDCLLDGKGGLAIGEGTILAPRVVIWTSSHRYDQVEMLPYDLVDEHRRVTIGRGVWIGLGAMVVPGAEIEDGAVIAMGSVVTGRVAKGQIVGGNPAREIGRRPAEVVDRLVSERAYVLRRHADRRTRQAQRAQAARPEAAL
jgi:acetyltransferase-like isoleucine patch superfamily enzyme